MARRIAALLLFAMTATAFSIASLSPVARNLFHTSLDYTSSFFDPSVNFLLSSDPSTPGMHDTRSSAMYAVGLLLRNEGDDVERAVSIIENVAGSQYRTSANGSVMPWYGTYPHAPEEPAPGDFYGDVIYTNFDPNWRDFVGTAWCFALATREHLLPVSTIKTMEESLLIAAEGVLTRYQGRGPYANAVNVDTTKDNLDEAYTNPWLMGTFLLSYIGHRTNCTDLIARSESDAKRVYDLFTYRGFNTFSEYNSGTYTGVDVYALALWIAYSPSNSTLPEYGTYMLQHTMEDLGLLYHAGLRNLAGPFDRTYGFDQTRYHSVLGYFIAALLPCASTPAPVPTSLPGSLHINDYTCFPYLAATLSSVVRGITPQWVLDNFAQFENGKERIVEREVRTNTVDPTAVRNVTAWLGDNISIGAQSLDEPYVRQSSMVPALIQWALPSLPHTHTLPRIAYIALSPPTASVIKAIASRRQLTISFPPSSRTDGVNATLPGTVVFALGGFGYREFDAGRGLEGVPGLDVSVETSGFGEPGVAYNGSSSFK
ncbi:hypothetical protein NEOLEDRAFT_1179434 [Neolentinus lepideus HHB14362 ss-1]|uniref:DUF1793-domain-containing protein n=1 Tax=Neolentinus lepideus HHB14362 ss-1 TaxID=1314782 RepID=A0A165RRK4_9AGAM|nr:hypothetical protein NEOLEDRAFT_1179434 [Neolentinus lepideus HHB14362 ss-1]